MKKVIMIILAMALCTTSAFAAGTPEPIYSNDSLILISSDPDIPPSCVLDFNYVPSSDKPLYFLFDGVFYAFSPIITTSNGSLEYVYGDTSAFEGSLSYSMIFYWILDYGFIFSSPCFSCLEESHSHSVAIYDEYPFASSAPVTDTPAFIATTGDGFKMMNSITAGIMGNPVLLFLLAASLIPVGIALFKALKNAASRK